MHFTNILWYVKEAASATSHTLFPILLFLLDQSIHLFNIGCHSFYIFCFIHNISLIIIYHFIYYSFLYTNSGHKSDLCYSVQTMFFSPNYTENLDKMDVSAPQIGQSHTRIQNIPPHSQERTLSFRYITVPPKSYYEQWSALVSVIFQWHSP